MLYIGEIFQNVEYRKKSSIFRFTLMLYYVLTNLQLAFEFVSPFIIREGALRGDEVED